MYSGWFITTPECSTVYHALPSGASFWLVLFSIDQDLAAKARQRGCSCGGRLDCAHFPRKPRGTGRDLPREYGYREGQPASETMGLLIGQTALLLASAYGR